MMTYFMLFFNFSLQLFAVPEGKSGPQVIEMLTKRAIALGAVLSGSFIVDCETYSSTASLGKKNTNFFYIFPDSSPWW